MEVAIKSERKHKKAVEVTPTANNLKFEYSIP